DPNGDPLTYAWDLDNDGQYDDATGATPGFAGVDDGVYPIGLEVSDGSLAGTSTSQVTVNNVAPSVDAGPDQTAAVGDTVTLPPATFTDPGLLDTHTATLDWGDGTIAAGAVTENGGNGSVDGSHVYGNAGSYTVTVTVTDQDGGVGSDAFLVEVTGGAQAPIDDLTARPKLDKVQLVWTCVPGAAGYNVYRSDTTGGPYTLIAAGHQTDYCTYLDSGLTTGNTYYYVITWLDGSGREAPPSNEARATLTTRTR
ncbi:MAG TPA: PKD domain-containing protein, partial [bacterium]